MCGIAGVLGLPLEQARPAAERMLAALRHRGPDGEGLEVLELPKAPPVVLAHTRLAIVDLSPTGRQPMTLEGPRAPTITYNGEAYDAPERRAELEQLGHVFRGSSDTEVLLRGYREWGYGLYRRVRGMFAWCVADPELRQVWLARDRFGIKPLYLAELPGGGLLFASELRALLASGLVERRLHAPALESFLAQGAVIGDASLVAGVRLLPAGGSLIANWEGQVLEERIKWHPPFRRQRPPREEKKARGRRVDAVDRLQQTLREVVEVHLRADVEVVLFLSGGVDSAAMATLIREDSERGLHTITLGFDVRSLDEGATAAKIASALGTHHHARRLASEEFATCLDEVLGAADQPTVDGFNTWFVSRAARELGLKVVLSGVGGDELFCGYASFRDVPRARRLARSLGPLRGVLGLGAPLAPWLGGRAALKLAELGERRPELLELYLLRRELLLPGERRALFPPGLGAGVPEDALARLRREVAGLDPVNQISRFELGLFLEHRVLRNADVFSMAHSLELRVPLLDHVLAEELAPLPARWKLRWGKRRPKPLLCDAVGAGLPRAALGPKRGFELPWTAWFRGGLAERARAALAERATWQALGCEPEVPLALGERFAAGDPRLPGESMLALVALEDFARRHELSL